MLLHTPFLLALFTGCIRPEAGIDNTRVTGVLRVEPDRVREPAENNDVPLAFVETDPLGYGYRLLDGELLDVEFDADTNAVRGDIDYWQVNSPRDRGVSDENPLVFEVTLTDPEARARLWVKNVDELTGIEGTTPTDVSEEDFTGSTEHTLVASADVNYVIGLGGLEGTGPVGYKIAILGDHPDTARVLVGAYTNDDPEDRGELLGGTNAKPFTADGYAFESWYEMLFLRDFATDEEGDVVTLDEDIPSAYVFAGNWANLAQGLPAGTWHSRTPVEVDLKNPGPRERVGTPPTPEEPSDTGAAAGDDYETYPLIRDEPTYPTVRADQILVVDRYATAVIGQTWEVVEPNDTNLTDALQYGDAFDPTSAQDLGILSGPGFVDEIVGGAMRDNGDGYWTGENDSFKFQVPEPLLLNFNLSWSNPDYDLDIVLIDAEGNTLDQGFYGFPEIPEVGTEVLQPDTDYFLGVLLWIGPGVSGEEVPYDLTLEQLSP